MQDIDYYVLLPCNKFLLQNPISAVSTRNEEGFEFDSVTLLIYLTSLFGLGCVHMSVGEQMDECFIRMLPVASRFIICVTGCLMQSPSH